MYNYGSDNSNSRFGLNRELTDSKGKENVHILKINSIKDISEIMYETTNLFENDYIQQTLDMHTVN